MWEKREAEWDRERTARDRLMTEVIPAVTGVGWPVPGPAVGIPDHVLTLPDVLGAESSCAILNGLFISL